MKEIILKHKTPVIILAAILLTGIGIAIGMGIMSNMSEAKGSSYIGKEQAKTIALESAGVSPAKATFTKTELDRDDGTAVYEIEFFSGINEYKFEIHAKTGSILEKKSKALSRTQETSGTQANASSSSASEETPGTDGNTSDYIGIDRAKAIALKHAGLAASDVLFTKAKLDTDDGVRTYEIEFLSGNREYEYEIHAYTGEILDMSNEYEDGYYLHHNENHGHHGMNAGSCPYPGCNL